MFFIICLISSLFSRRMADIQSSIGLPEEVVHYATYFLDQVVMKVPVGRHALLTVALACVMISAKNEGYGKIQLCEDGSAAYVNALILEAAGDTTITIQQLNSMEVHVLNTLGWNLNVPAPVAYVLVLLDAMKEEIETVPLRIALHRWSLYFLEMAIVECPLLKMKNSAKLEMESGKAKAAVPNTVVPAYCLGTAAWICACKALKMSCSHLLLDHVTDGMQLDEVQVVAEQLWSSYEKTLLKAHESPTQVVESSSTSSSVSAACH